MPSSQVPKSSSLHDELRGGRGVEGAGYVPPGPSNASTSQRQGFGIDVAVSALERAKHIFRNVCSELQKVPMTVERMSCISGTLPEGHQFNAEEAVDYIEMERILIGDMRDGAADLVQSSVRLLNNMKCFKSMQDSRCKPYEESAKVVIRQIEKDEAAATNSRAGDVTGANVPDHETNDVGLERVVDDIEQDEAAATDSRADDGTEVNVSDHHTNDVGLEQPVVDETSHNVDAVVDRGVNDPSTNKCKPCSPVGDVAFNVSNSKIDDVSVNASKMTDVDREAVVSGGDDAHGVPLSSGCDVGAKVADEDFGVASILDGKPSGVGIAGNENLSDFEDLPPENFSHGGLDYGDALQDASSMEEVPSEADDLLLSISSGPLTQEALVSSQDFLSTDPESAAILVSSQDVPVPSSNPETGGILVSSQELPSSSHTDSAGEWLDLNEHDYRIFGSQFSELERVSIDLSQWRSLEKTRSSVLKGRLGALKGSTAACVESPSTPKNPIVELIDSDDDAFDKIAGMGRVTRSATVAKGLSPLAGIVARRAGGARKDPALDSGNVTSTKRAPRAPIKFCSPVQQLQPHRFPHLDKARKLYNMLFSDEACEKYVDNTFSMIPQPDGSISSFTGKRIWEVFAPGQMMEGDVMDFLIDDWKKDPDRNVDFASGKRLCLTISRMVQVMKDVYGDAQYKASKQPKWELFAKKPTFVKVPLQGANECGHYTLKYAGSYDGEKIVGNIQYKDPRIVDWRAEDLYRVVFNQNNQLLVTELPKEFQPLAPGA
ncbi:hypothetical protein VPH35_002582 [Triticum aestivum]